MDRPTNVFEALQFGMRTADDQAAAQEKRQMERQRFQSELQNEDSLRQYRQAQMQQMKDALTQRSELNVLKEQQAESMRQQQLYPVLKALSEDSQDAMSKGDMGRLQANAQRYNILEKELPPSVRGALSKSSTYQVDGNNVESNFDPDLLGRIVGSAARPKEVAQLQQQQMRNEGNANVQGMRNEGNLNVARMNAQTRQAVAQMAKTKDIKNLQGLLTKYIQDGDEQNANYIMQVIQAIKPTTQETTLVDGQISRVDKTTPTPPPVMPRPAAAPVQQQPTPQAAPSGPQPGMVKGGYRFKGGNPADKNNWEKI